MQLFCEGFREYPSEAAGLSVMEPPVPQIWKRGFHNLHRCFILHKRRHSGQAGHADITASNHSRHVKPTLLVSRLYQPSNLRDVGQDSRLQGEMTCKSQMLMQQAGLIHPSNPGCYYYLPVTVRSMEKLV
ncbi:hypothetical protein CHARACLAT_029340, partial [Characodon lateralis]|nr:hypothetical protein [Characodon lateralis]